MAIYDKIKGVCKEKGISVQSLEMKLGFERSSLYKMNFHMPSADRLLKVAKELDKPIEYFLEDQKEIKEDE